MTIRLDICGDTPQQALLYKVEAVLCEVKQDTVYESGKLTQISAVSHGRDFNT